MTEETNQLVKKKRKKYPVKKISLEQSDKISLELQVKKLEIQNFIIKRNVHKKILEQYIKIIDDPETKTQDKIKALNSLSDIVGLRQIGIPDDDKVAEKETVASVVAKALKMNNDDQKLFEKEQALLKKEKDLQQREKELSKHKLILEGLIDDPYS